ncbi:MAG: ribonuclease E/G [Candidatus Thorarchaeota archaeon]|jgi:predicted RNA-binding protein associated with RNAse of E/G family
MIKARIRGIYAQSLTQIMLQNHFEMVQPTPEVARRFGLPFRSEIPDVDIWDRSDLQGIVAIAYESILVKLTEVLRRRLGWVITRTPRVAKSSIYNGFVLGRDEKTGQTRIDLGIISGLLPDRGLRRGDNVMVQVRAHDYGRKAPVLSSSITIPGRSAVLLPEPVVRLSTKIKDQETRANLMTLGRKLRHHTEDWGILWRTAAEKLTEEELRNEVEDLLDVAQRIYSKYSELDTTDLLFEGTSNADIEFPAEVKEALDKTRAKIKPTVDRHHFYKSAGYAPLVDLVELVIEDRPEERKYITSKLDKVIGLDMPRVDDPINIEHVKLDGRSILLTKGRVVETHSRGLMIRRQFRHTSRKLKLLQDYPEGVEVPRDDGDYALTEVVPGSMTLVTEYYSRNDELKGTYLNINTGVELYPSNGSGPGRIRYVDLEIDVIKTPFEENGRVRVIDQHLLKRAVQRGFITKEMANQARSRADAIHDELLSQSGS